ncbi:MAG: Lrp/AsnC ligand binding domain-containing protein [Patescibacteria group bacterium]|nr:Lrp/AsnC ligand binding domain-containing protein [Patescibacteria group bacterium]
MKVGAYVLIKVQRQDASDVALEILFTLRVYKKVVKAHVVTGMYDVIANIEGDDIKDLGDTVVQIHDLKGVRSTVTCIVAA